MLDTRWCSLAGHLEAMACSCAHPAHEHRAISQARGPAARTQRALKLATAALAATAGVPAPKPHLPASRLASALTLCASDSVCRGRLQRCGLPILMLMLALPTIGLLALRCAGSHMVQLLHLHLGLVHWDRHAPAPWCLSLIHI